MFITYLSRELRRRRRQAAVVAVGLGLGIALVMVVTAVADGVHDAQGQVLHSLYGVGTDVTVTEAAVAGSGGPQRFGLNPGDRTQQGHAFSRDRTFGAPGLAMFSASSVSSVGRLPKVSQAAGALSLEQIHLTGHFVRPSGTGSGGSGFGAGGGSGTPGALPSVPPIQISSSSLEGIDVTATGVGPLAASEITSGRFFSASNATAKVAIVDAAYAKQQRLKVGSSVSVGGTNFTVIGIASSPAGGQPADVYLPLAEAQKVAGVAGDVNQVFVRAASASAIPAVQSEIHRALPKATITTAQDLASQVSGSLSTASSLAGNLATWLSVVALAAAFAVASLLTVSSVVRRVREFGTLKALGWRTRRVVAQILGETLSQGVLGAAVGIALGAGGAALVARLAPTLRATVGPVASAGPGGFAGPFARAAAAGAQTVQVHLSAPVHAGTFLMAFLLALGGGLLAGLVGGWRVARLRPAEALRRVE